MVCALVCGLNMRSSMTAKITKGPPYCHHTFGWTPKPRKKIKILLHTYGLRKGDQRGILGDCGQDLGYLSAGFRLELAGTYEAPKVARVTQREKKSNKV